MASHPVTVLTVDEVDALRQFRRRIPDILSKYDEFHRRDDNLIRWLRARNLDLDRAEDMIRSSMKWRAANQVDSILKNGVDRQLSKKFPYTMDGVDKSGRPVVTLQMGSWDIKSFVDTKGVDRFIHFVTQLFEASMAMLRRETENVEEKHQNKNGFVCLQLVVLVDMEGYSYRQLANMKAVRSIIQMAAMYEAHYPECFGTCLVINAPAVFSILFGMMKQVMAPRTMEKIRIFPNKREQWQPVILELIDASQIRKGFGGTKSGTYRASFTHLEAGETR